MSQAEPYPADIAASYVPKTPTGAEVSRLVHKVLSELGTPKTETRPAAAGERPTSEFIVNECELVKEVLLSKNAKYGDSALHPMRCFSKASPVEQLYVRIDDKLSRIQTSGVSGPDEDTLLDLIGYLVLLRVAYKKLGGKVGDGR